MEKGYSAEKEGYNKTNLSDKQKALIENLQKSDDGDAIQAAKDAGYSNPYQAVKTNSKLIQELVDDEFIVLSMKSVKVMNKILESSSGVPQATEKLKVAALSLERTHPKTDHINVEGDVKSSIFVIPNKKPLDEKPNEQN